MWNHRSSAPPGPLPKSLFSHYSTRTDGRTDKASHRVACPQLKRSFYTCALNLTRNLVDSVESLPIFNFRRTKDVNLTRDLFPCPRQTTLLYLNIDLFFSMPKKLCEKASSTWLFTVRVFYHFDNCSSNFE